MHPSTRITALAALLAIAPACAIEDPAPDDELEEVDEDEITPEERGVLDVTSFEERDAPADLDGELSPFGVCVRGPLGPGKVKWLWSVNGAEWRSEIENGHQWVPAEFGEQATDGIHRNGWGCTMLKIPDHCTTEVSSNGSISYCCNAAASVFYGKVAWVHYSAVVPIAPPGC